MESKSTDVEGIRMRWEEQGEGYPVVLLHGIPTCPSLWRHVVSRLQGARALAWEMVGYGASIPEGRGRNISVGKQADYLASWIRQMELVRPVLVGHDLGGGVAQILAVRHPGLVGGLVLTNAISYDSWPIPSVKLLRLLGGIVEKLPEPASALIMGTLLLRGHDNRRCAWESFRRHYSHYASHGGTAALVHQVRSLDVRDTLDVADRISHLGVPARLVWGAADQFQQIGYGYRLAYELGARIDRIERGKHFVPEDHADRVADAIHAVLEQIKAEQ